MGYVYRHIRLDTNEVFYIGIGSDTNGKHHRAYDVKKRTSYWKNIVNKHGYKVEIIEDNLEFDVCKEKEIYWIAFYGRIDLNEGTLVNMTNGGDGTLGYKHSREHLEKISKLLKGRIFSEETKQKMSKARKGSTVSEETKQKLKIANTGKKHTEESKKKIREGHTGKKFSTEHIHNMSLSRLGTKYSDERRQKMKFEGMYGKKHSDESKKKMSERQLGKVYSDETKKKMSDSKMGEKNVWYGKTHNESSKEKISDALRGKIKSTTHIENIKKALKLVPKIECPHCGIKTNISNGKRWHFDNCKHINLVVSE
jgi:hypothetical protein